MSIIVTGSSILLASVSYIEPVVDTSYFDIQVVAEVTMPDVLSVDIITPTDLVSLTTTKSASDTQNTYDDQYFSITKGLSDYPNLVDSISFGDIQPHRGVSDSLNNSTAVISSIGLSKVLFDTVALIDSTIATRLYERAFSDSISETDLYLSSFDSGVTIDTTTTTDNSFRKADKTIFDGLNLIDNMDGDLTYAVVKVVGELLSTSDSTIVAFQPTKADNVLTSSSGVLSMQDYSDITYFLEDYVGISRTFT